MRYDIKNSRTEGEAPYKGRIRIWTIIMILVILAAGLTVWLFFGVNISAYNGYCTTTATSAVLYLPLDIAVSIDEGDTVWIGQIKGEVKYIDMDKYLVYSEIKDNEQYSGFINSPYFDRAVTYVAGTAGFSDDVSDYDTFIYVIGSSSPAEALLSGGEE